MEWEKIIPTLVGGGISAFTAVCMFALAQWVDRRKRSAALKKEKAMDAYVGLLKLMDTANAIEGLARHIDKQISEASIDGRSDVDTASIVRAHIGARPNIEHLTAKEMSFLFGENSEFVSDIWEIQMRAENNWVVMEEFSKLRIDFDAFFEQKSHTIASLDGTVLTANLDDEDARVAHLRLARMNSVIIPLIVALEEDRKKAVVVVEWFIKAARDGFGDDFPVKKVEWKAAAQC